MRIADHLRTHASAISNRWERVVLAEVPALSALPRTALVDHLPEFIEGLAAWLDADDEKAAVGFGALIEGHALQRHSSGVDLETLSAEYATLRRVILEQLLEVAKPEELAQSLVRLEAGLDRAISEAARRYSAARDDIRERFIGILAHDLRDPLTTVMMSATILADMTLGEKQAQLVERINRGAQRIERMMDDLLDFARGRLSGGIPITPELADMGEICREAIDEARALGPAREVTFEGTGDLRGLWDRERIRQALANLLSNARHYGTGAIRVRAWEREDRHAVLASVQNGGSVLAPETIKRIFDPFARATTKAEPGSRRRGGLGLGLYIVEQIAKAHGGVCRASSAEDTTTFTMEFPRTPLEETPGRPLSG
jgi:signal transduction histidine kinase